MKILASVSVMAVALAIFLPASAHATDPDTLWQRRCSKCHGEDGRGDTKLGHKLYINDLTDASIQSKFTDDEAANSIKIGLKDAKGNVIMKAVDGLSDEEVKALVGHVRALKK